MSSLPTTTQDLKSGPTSRANIPIMFRKLFKTPRNLDFETAIWEMFNLIFKPRKAFRSFYYQRQTKHQWARDDPSFFILQIGLLTISSVVWSIVYGHSFGGFLKMMINMVFVDFFLFGFIVASLFWIILNRPMFKFRSAMESQVEWAYCFDVHCNAFLIIWVSLYFLQFILLPIINLHKWIGLFVGNTLYCFAFAHYFILTFYGYSQLAFLKNINFILFPSLAFAVIYLISLIGIDLSKTFSFYK
ncbi:hypothetical protein Kpol_2001p2 [Vanderwaltozyma polyspora DSM 70294]|uniref:Protein GMH1 n=1 Tax=Vanderwaltozyma polyspora (strain ATCC 22028 / DSM 70294 / BCRC 21397 / CBS 2163 / NBRC 10782 / NRRL Y-8283 / UCD 57-17) TaxID=436907 RepID=A7TGN9_VANPO|nr:uncharacterized protein Kpol_2001p2 [Vanderwaltozyma polyspora DSM 70294]EDO18502.1 hypothetical protein Kpol_2001p2 [Vanderwaltozyma polyspora DSM 70294]